MCKVPLRGRGLVLVRPRGHGIFACRPSSEGRDPTYKSASDSGGVKDDFPNKTRQRGPCVSKTVAGVLLAHLKIVGHVTHFCKNMIPICDPPQYSWALEFPYSNVYRTNGTGNFLITKKFLIIR